MSKKLALIVVGAGVLVFGLLVWSVVKLNDQKTDPENSASNQLSAIPAANKPEPVIENNNDALPEEPQTTTEIDTSDWQTYRNDEYGFEVKYPNGWKNSTEGESLEGIALNFEPENLNKNYSIPQVQAPYPVIEVEVYSKNKLEGSTTPYLKDLKIRANQISNDEKGRKVLSRGGTIFSVRKINNIEHIFFSGPAIEGIAENEEKIVFIVGNLRIAEVEPIFEDFLSLFMYFHN